MATLSPSKPRTMPGCGPTPVHYERSSPQRVAFVPRSALLEHGSQNPTATSPSSTSLSAVHAIQAFNSDDAVDGAVLLSAKSLRQEFKHDSIFGSSTSARSDRDSDEETAQGSSEASIEIITERDTIAYNDVRSASPRKPLPSQWLSPSDSPTSTTSQRTRAHGYTQTSPGDPPVDRTAVRATRSSIDIGKAHVGTISFLTKEALDAVDAHITSPTLRRSPSKIQRSPTKVPWNSQNVSHKVGSLRHNAASPTKPSPPRAINLGTHTTIEYRRAPSSIVSTGATSFHTAHGSPVRSSACSQSSFSSAEDLNDTAYLHCCDNVADVDLEQVNDSSSNAMATSTTAPKALLRSRTSKPELLIRIPPSDTIIDHERRSPSTLASATSSTAVSVGEGSSPGLDHFESHHGTSRIPRMTISKGSSARGPTLSSTLKQTKSTQTLRSPKATKSKTDPRSPTTSKVTGTKSLRHVRTVDSTGSTPILANRKGPDFSIPASVAGVTTLNIERTARASDVDLATSYLQKTVLRPSGLAENLPASSTTSRATSTSTVKASRIVNDPSLSRSAGARTRESPDSFAGNIHSSDADDEYDDSSISAPARGRSAQYDPSTRRTTFSEVSMQSSSTSDLRPTANEFVPTLKDASENVTPEEPSLPDMYALDGYGIPWFYHMYPVPWLLPPMYTQTRSKSPKKLRPRKQRPTITHPVTDQTNGLEVCNLTQTGTAVSAVDLTTSAREDTRGGDAVPAHQTPTGASDNLPAAHVTRYVKASNVPFSMQLDMIARQAALQTKINTVQPQVDLTAIRNVPARDEILQNQAHGYNTVPSSRRNQRQIGNGLYGGRGSVGVPLYATAPFPVPIPPMGRPVEQSGGAYIGYAVGTQGCDTVEIEKAAEYGGGQACNTCEPDH